MTQQPSTTHYKQLAILLAMLVAVMPLSIDSYLPAMPQMAELLSTDIHRVEQSLSAFIFGVAIGQLTGGPISDIKGRRITALVGLLIYIVATIMLVLLSSIEQLLWLRFIQAFGGGIATVTVAALVRDRFSGREAAKMFALIGIIMMAAPLIAPMLGAALNSLGGWRLIFFFLFVYSATVWVLWKWKIPIDQLPKHQAQPFFRQIWNNYKSVFRQPEALGFLFLQALSFSGMFVFLTESSFVYMNLYGLDTHQYSWAFGANIITMMLFNRITAYRLRSTDAKNILLSGIVIKFMADATFILLLIIFGLPPFWLVLLCVMVSVGTQGLIVANTQACYMGYFQAEGGSANAVLGTMQFLIASFIGLLTTHFHNGTIVVMPAMMFSSTIIGIGLLFIFSRNVWRKDT